MTLSEAKARCWAEIDLDVLEANYDSAMRILDGKSRLIPVLKANAYGLGAPEVARALWNKGARLFAVASLGEAEELMRAVPSADALVMGLIGPALYERAIREGALLTFFSPAQAEDIARAAKAAKMTARVHAKVETGLNRLGLPFGEAAEAIERLARTPGVRVEGLYTHLALRNAELDAEQMRRLLSVRSELRARGIDVPMTHAADSIGMVRYPDYRLDAVRAGAWLYGVCPRGYDGTGQCRLPVRFVCRVAEIHAVSAGECLGYDETHPLSRDSRVATLSAGYADGYPRVNTVGCVEIRGLRAPVAGLVCMDQMMADVTDIPDAREGDEALLLGGSIGVNEYADQALLNRNEALARLTRRVPRVYTRGTTVEKIINPMEES